MSGTSDACIQHIPMSEETDLLYTHLNMTRDVFVSVYFMLDFDLTSKGFTFNCKSYNKCEPLCLAMFSGVITPVITVL